MVGQHVDVLVEKKGRLSGQMIGKSQHLHAVHMYAPDVEIGEIRRVRVTDSKTNSLGAELVETADLQ
ncbi:MAG TPA: tRNA (N6-isopentenyl adenosine(37)-C2)-methylthiotransferase MiaB, partial [Rhodobacteraceae bacterium]|nr:tRNA (N6-isopentenyl adenosine(37)-C2)-methylthiotransferase MiaB [Paracoccaceae bacterium]